MTGDALWIAPEPRCPRHGQLHREQYICQGYTASRWACHGFDGEGCDYEPPAPEWAEVPGAEVTALRWEIKLR